MSPERHLHGDEVLKDPSATIKNVNPYGRFDSTPIARQSLLDDIALSQAQEEQEQIEQGS